VRIQFDSVLYFFVFCVTSSLAVVHTIYGRPWLLVARGALSSDTRSKQKPKCNNNGAAVTDRRARYSFRIEILSYPTCIRRPVRGVPVRILPWCLSGKTRMVWVPEGEIILKICLFVLTECTNVTYRWERQTHRHRHRFHSIARQNCNPTLFVKKRLNFNRLKTKFAKNNSAQFGNNVEKFYWKILKINIVTNCQIFGTKNPNFQCCVRKTEIWWLWLLRWFLHSLIDVYLSDLLGWEPVRELTQCFLLCSPYDMCRCLASSPLSLRRRFSVCDNSSQTNYRFCQLYIVF